MRKKSKSAPKSKLHPKTAGNAEVQMGRRIRLRRIEIGISQTKLGDHLGVSFQQVQKYERGVNRVSTSRLQQIAAMLGMEMAFFYGRTRKKLDVESLLSLDSGFSLRLLRAYTAIKDRTIQRQFVALVERIADSQG